MTIDDSVFGTSISGYNVENIEVRLPQYKTDTPGGIIDQDQTFKTMYNMASQYGKPFLNKFVGNLRRLQREGEEDPCMEAYMQTFNEYKGAKNEGKY